MSQVFMYTQQATLPLDYPHFQEQNYLRRKELAPQHVSHSTA